jgi:hypothetical protein
MPAKKKSGKEETEPQAPEMTESERRAFHQGALTTLIGERNELIRVIQATEQLMQAHIEELKKLGVKFPEEKK